MVELQLLDGLFSWKLWQENQGKFLDWLRIKRVLNISAWTQGVGTFLRIYARTKRA